MPLASVTLALSLLAILLSLPALFLALYAVVLMKAERIGRELAEQNDVGPGDRETTRELLENRSGVNPYELGDDDDDDESLESFGM